jgi:integrase
MATAFWKKDVRPGRKPVLTVKWLDAQGGRVEERRPNDRTKKQALDYARERERDAELLRKGLALEVKPVLFGAIWDSWWDRDGRRRRSDSKHAFRSMLEKHLAPLRPFVLVPATAGAFAAQLDAILAAKEDAGELGPQTLNHLRAGAHRMFEHAKDPKVALWTAENPIRWVKRRTVPRSKKETLAHHEVQPVLDGFPAPVLGAPWRWAAAICLYTGARPGEAFGLHKNDVDLERGTLTLRYSWGSPLPKDDEPRTVVLVPELRPHLIAALEASGGALVLPRADGSAFDDSIRHGLVDHLRRAVAKAGLVTGFQHTCRRCKASATRTGEALPFTWLHLDDGQRDCAACGMKLWIKPLARQLRFYDLRHTHATLLRRGGVDLGTVQKALGHSDPKITASTYDHTELEDHRAHLGAVLTFNADAGEGAREVRELSDGKNKGPGFQDFSGKPRPSKSRGDRIRTCDPLHPKQVRYQAALRPEFFY